MYSGSKTPVIIIRTACIVLVVIVLEWVGVVNPIRNLGEAAIKPIQQMGVVLAQAIIFPWQLVRMNYDGARRIQDLEQRYSEMAAQVGMLEGVKKENEELRLLVGGEGQPRRVVAAPIISLAAPALSAGAAQNLTPGLPVLASGTLMGVIQDVGERQSRVALIATTTGPKILARTQSGVEGIVVGDGQRPLLTEVPLDESVAVGERVVTVGQGFISSDLFIGRVIRVEVDPSATTQTIYLDQVVSFFDAKVVEVRL